MSRLPWTKFQDFYLRFGFLKVLVAILDPNRRSAANEVLTRRIQETLFAPARGDSALWSRVDGSFPWFAEKSVIGADRGPTVVEALLLDGGCPSQLYAVTERTSYKILDWARDLKLVGAGNQIAETGILLRGLLPQESVSEFLRGELLAWNPFLLTHRERLFLLFHLCEVDGLTVEVLDEVTRPSVVEPIESSQAAAMTCRALFRVLDRARGQVAPGDLPALRRASELASVMAEELQIEDLMNKPSSAAGRRLPKPTKIPPRGGLQPREAKASQRRTTKNADHQTIPRFEQLVDLGMLSKPEPDEVDGEAVWKARRRWRYARRPACRVWAERRRETLDGEGPWEWRGFARAAIGSGFVGVVPKSERPTHMLLGGFLWRAYQSVHRQVGHTPFHSIALMAMIEAVVDGFAIEMRDFHELMLRLKRTGALDGHVFFASGNEIDKMFVLLRPSFLDALAEVPGHFDAGAAN